ncbi:predicted protein [Naegleria gruberi]|uniref:Predicted protein n=1 Tax=Naegleria gruberi TaxID=5762 RepID=D2V5U6_NAEGR|nr:uncharacterized protein NAEGRDRAFT_64207 [Naegleria gruberi]EFC47858.1 predicted protein [Naegleria gruberi]|eukprot:XP_002680602.1 predicted protein [Naegleria gruberi strain NEG-M]
MIVQVLGYYLRYPNFTEYLGIMERMVYSISTPVYRSNLIDELDKQILRLLPNSTSKSFELLCKWRLVVGGFNITIKKIVESESELIVITQTDNRNEIMRIVVGLEAEFISVEEIGTLILKFEPLDNEWRFRITFALLSSFELEDTQKHLIGNIMLQNLRPYLENIDSQGVLLVLSSLDIIPQLLKDNNVWIELVHQYQSAIKEKFDKYEWLDDAAEYYSQMYNVSRMLCMSSKDHENIYQWERDVER